MEIDSPHNTLLRTKFHRPPIPNNHIQRPSLISKLERQSKVPLILVSAPAGYGKSTLVSFWLRESKRSSCWLSLDENDNNLVQFLLYFIGAVQTIFPDVLDDILAMLDTPIIPPLPALATTVINELDQLEDEFIIVLDDVQHIQDKNICEFLKLLPPCSVVLNSERFHITIKQHFCPATLRELIGILEQR
jgi:LuxR family maltose regulon positive regulatory protein